MKLFSKLLLISYLFVIFCLTTTTVFADAKSDYEYQYSRYRQNNIEYTILKKDFLANPTLDNQQKAVLAAKETIYTRELAKANFASYLLSLCESSKINYAPIKPILDSLAQAKSFYLSEAEKSQTVITPAQLATFTQNYLTATIPHDRSFRTGVVACKIAQLVRFQVESKNALDIILPKLATPFSTPLQTKIDDLQSQGNKINEDINTFTNKIFSEEDILNIDYENYFTDKSETIKKIQSLQIKWLDSLIDIDLNYAHS
jgi:hypothetical protein